MFRVFGHDNVSVLDGGLEKWCSEDGATADGEMPTVEAGTFVPTYRENLVRGFADVAEGLAAKAFQVCDARNAPRYNGEAPEPNPKLPSGHMKGATNVPFFNMLDPETKTLKSADAIKEVYASFGIDLNKPTIMTCGSGVTATVLAFTAFMAGQQSIPVFDGSWTEFVQRATPEQVESLQFPLGEA
ncbi:3-mercaptopyruvate sulfurtransferase-like [Sycon ciliatum]